MLTDPVAVLGIGIGGQSCLQGPARTKFDRWLAQVRHESTQVLGPTGWPGELAVALVSAAPANGSEWIHASLAGGIPILAPANPDLARIIRQVISKGTEVTAVEAALLLAALSWATERALDVNLNAMAVSDTLKIMERVGGVFSRWVWEDKPRTSRRGAKAAKWHIENEYHFQSLLFAVLKPVLPQLEEEQYLASTGQVQPRADLCLLSLALLIEVKFWYRRDAARRIIEEVAADVTLYLKSGAPYTSLIVAIWDDGARTEEHESLKRGLSALQGICGVVIVNRPSWMP